MNIVAPNVNNLLRGGAIIYFDRDNLSQFFDLGNIPEFNFSTPTQFVEHKSARSGRLIMDRREPTEFSQMFKVKIDEYNIKNFSLLFNSVSPSSFSQSSASATVVSIVHPTLGCAYFLGAYRVTNVIARVGGVAKTLGTDYVLEPDLGAIIPLPTGGILSSDTLAVTFDQPAIAGDIIYPQSKTSAIQGAMKIFFRASDGRLYLYEHTTAQIGFSGDTALTGNDFGKTDAEILIIPDYQTDAAHPFGKITAMPAA